MLESKGEFDHPWSYVVNKQPITSFFGWNSSVSHCQTSFFPSLATLVSSTFCQRCWGRSSGGMAGIRCVCLIQHIYKHKNGVFFLILNVFDRLMGVRDASFKFLLDRWILSCHEKEWKFTFIYGRATSFFFNVHWLFICFVLFCF